jgi:hypothetical protein
MHRRFWQRVFCAIACASVMSFVYAGQALQSGVPILVPVADLLPDTELFIDVPDGTTHITVALSGASAFDDWDLTVRFGSSYDLDGVPQTPIALVDAMIDQSDYYSAGADADENVVITVASNPPVQTGRWYIGVLRFQSATPNITLTATLGTGPLQPLQIELINGDPPGEGFNDPTPIATRGTIKGATTLGEARWNALESAVAELESRLYSPIPVIMRARFEDLGGDDDEDGGVPLASAGATLAVGNTPGVEFEDTFYVGAVVQRLAGTNKCHFSGDDCDDPDIIARFNAQVDTDEAAGDARWFYGKDPADKPPNTFDFIDVAMHEIIHGLGFIGYYDVETGAKPATTGGQEFDDIFGQRLEFFLNLEPDYGELSDDDRVAANTSLSRLHFTGMNATDSDRNIYANTNDGHPQLHAPATPEPGSSVYHLHKGFGNAEIMTPTVSANAPVLRDPGIGIDFLKDLGWDDFGFGTGAADDMVALGMSYDRSRSGHGYDFQKVGDLYFVVFYTYESVAAEKGVANADPTWYLAVGTVEDGVFTTDASGLQRFTYDAANNPPQSLDDGFEGDLSITFGVDADHPNCDDGVNRNSALSLAAFDWSIGADSGSWCTEPLVIYEGSPDVNPTGHWFAGGSDQGWGMTVYFQGDGVAKDGSDKGTSTLEFLVLYFYDALGLPRWALGVKEPSALDNTVNMDSFKGFSPAATPVPVTTTSAGTIGHSFSSQTAGMVDIAVTAPGGSWTRDTDIEQLSNPAE